MSDRLGKIGSPLFGYGCTSREPQSGGGRKQKFSFRFRNQSQALCPGDSGGPAFFGGAAAGGDQWGVNSDYDLEDVPWTDMNDVFGDVVARKRHIVAIIQRWSGRSYAPGIDLPGHGYTNFITTSSTACRQACEESVKCRGYTHSTKTNRCYLKSRVSGWRPCSYCNSGIPRPLNSGLSRPGPAYKTFAPKGAGGAEACLAACAADAKCAAYDYQTSILISQAPTCLLKEEASAATVRSSSSSGARRSRENNTARVGGRERARFLCHTLHLRDELPTRGLVSLLLLGAVFLVAQPLRHVPPEQECSGSSFPIG